MGKGSDLMVVKQLLDVTEALKQMLEKFPQMEEREEYIGQINYLLDKREEFMGSLPRSYTKEERELGSKIITLNHSINERLEEFMQEINLDIQNINQGKLAQNKYNNQVYSGDGMFIDKRK